MHWTRLMTIALLAFLAVDCSKKESPPTEAETIPFTSPSQMPGAETPAISGSAPVVMSDSLKGKWKAVKLMVEDKQANASKDYKVKLGSELVIPDSNLVIKVLDFLPDLKIEGNTFTTASDELLNPSVHIKVLEDGQEVFDGWLFQLFPSVHPFRHDRFNILLREPIPAS
jgi:hypothetical protein